MGSERDNAVMIVNANGVLIGFLALVISGKTLDSASNCAVIFGSKIAILPYVMGLSASCFVFSFLIALLVCLEMTEKFKTVNFINSSAIFLVSGLLFLLAFMFIVGFGYSTGLSYSLYALLSVFLGILLLSVLKLIRISIKYRKEIFKSVIIDSIDDMIVSIIASIIAGLILHFLM